MRFQAEFQLAQLKEGSYRWYIEFYAPQRIRRTFNLNRIANIQARRERGRELCVLLNFWLKAGMPIHRFKESEARRRLAESQRARVAPRGHTDVRRAIFHAVDIKEAKLKNPDSLRSYLSHSRLFVQFLESQQWEMLPVDEIQRHHIMAWLDHRQIHDNVRSNTINNNLRSLTALFNELKDRGFILENPCEDIKRMTPEPKLRRPFTIDEAQDALPYIYRNDPLLMLAILMEFCCYMRPKEIRRIKRREIDLVAGVIRIPAAKSKTGSKVGARTATIPDAFLPYFVELVPECSPNHYVFGQGFVPAGKDHCNKNRMYRRHLSMLQAMQRVGILEDIDGLTLYSWKDTGITEALKYIPLIGVQDQAGHTKPDMTLRYYAKPEVNHHIKAMRNNVLPKKEAPAEAGASSNT